MLADPFKPSLTDPRNTQRFGTAPDPTTRTQPSAIQPAPPVSASAGDTGFDSTGSVRKRKLAAKNPGEGDEQQADAPAENPESSGTNETTGS